MRCEWLASPHLHLRGAVSVVLIFANPIDEKWYLIAVLICVDMVVDD